MSSGDDDQQTTLDNTPDIHPSRSLQERILSLYKSSSLVQTAIGVWAKLLVETAIMATPLAVIILAPGFLLAWLGIGPVTYWNTLLAWGSFSATAVGIVWCCLDTYVEDGEDADENTTDD